MRAIFSFIFSLFLLFNTAFADDFIIPFSGVPFIESGLESDLKLIDKVDTSLNSGLLSILGVLYAFGDVVAVSLLAYIGVKILISSPQQKAQLKAGLVPYVVGLLFYIAGVPIAVLIINIIIKIF